MREPRNNLNAAAGRLATKHGFCLGKRYTYTRADMRSADKGEFMRVDWELRVHLDGPQVGVIKLAARNTGHHNVAEALLHTEAYQLYFELVRAWPERSAKDCASWARYKFCQLVEV